VIWVCGLLAAAVTSCAGLLRAQGGRPTPTRDGLWARERDENFPVALRVLPKAVRMDLHAVYALASYIVDREA
jgi:hypothetical protein